MMQISFITTFWQHKTTNRINWHGIATFWKSQSAVKTTMWICTCWCLVKLMAVTGWSQEEKKIDLKKDGRYCITDDWLTDLESWGRVWLCSHVIRISTFAGNTQTNSNRTFKALLIKPKPLCFCHKIVSKTIFYIWWWGNLFIGGIFIVLRE